MALSIPTQSQINVVATISDYPQKINLKEHAGSYLDQAAMLVYDDIQRFQTGPKKYFTAQELADFDYHHFVGNVFWFMDELTGMECDWDRTSSPGIKGNTAYGYSQFTNATVETAVNRYISHLESFNKRADTRNWKPYGVPIGTTVKTPAFITNLKNKISAGTYVHKTELDALTYDQTIALAFVHLHSKNSKDSNFRLLSQGSVTAAKAIYIKNHHSAKEGADISKTELRLNETAGGFFKIHYVPAPKIIPKQVAIVKEPLLTEEVTAVVIIDSWYVAVAKAIKAFFGDK